MTVRNRNPPMMYANSHTAGVEMSLREAFTKAGNAAKAQPQLLVCILPTTGVFSSVLI
jgi:eukaryotic translation initiation factor 2C